VEVLFLLLMPWFFRNWESVGMVAGLIAWSIRYALFTTAAIDMTAWMLLIVLCCTEPAMILYM